MNEEFYVSIIGEIFDGYSEILFKETPIFVKHVSIQDQRYLHKYYEKYTGNTLGFIAQGSEDGFGKNMLVVLMMSV